MGKIALKAVEYARSKVGGRYSQEDRWRDSPYTRDCSSFMYSAWEAAGVKLVHKDTGKRVDHSSAEVYAKGFTLLYPSSYSQIGKTAAAPSSIINTLHAGDMLFYATRSDRDNRIGHVSMAVGDGVHIVHARNPDLGILYNELSYMKDKICAVIRYKEEALMNGWHKIDGKWRYIRDGKLLKGWHSLPWSGGRDWFYFDANGYMLIGWQRLVWEGKTDWYYFDKTTGAMASNCGVQDDKDPRKLWWVDKDGQMEPAAYRLILA